MSCLKDYLLLFVGIFIPWLLAWISQPPPSPAAAYQFPSASDATCAAHAEGKLHFSRPPPLILLTRGGFPARPCRCTFGRELDCSFTCCRQHLSVRIILTLKLL